MSQKVIGLFMLCCSTLQFFGQNLVYNSSFEDINEISNEWMGTFSKFNRAIKYWDSPTQGSPDLLHLQVKNRMMPRRNGFDLQPYFPRTGKVMVGIKTFGCTNSVMHCKEYLQVPLKQSLEIGAEYYVEFYVSPLNNSILTNNIGMGFSQKRIKLLHEEGLYKIKPKIYHKDILFPNAEWQRISGNFIADSTYNYLIIGNFFEDRFTKNSGDSATIPYSYIFIDDIKLFIKDSPTLDLESINLEQIQFQYDKADLTSDAYSILNELVTFLKRYILIELKIKGHTDDTGNDNYNLELSIKRAKTIYDYLIAQGISRERLSYEGYGSTLPILEEDNEGARQVNRRVEFEFFNY